ncbi:TPA: PIG-L deacetylase family protein, partial [Streptococcus suis]
IGVEYANLGFSDSLFRLRKDEEKLKKEILEKIKEINFDYIIFPIGIGNHIDHLILNEISRDKFFIKKVLYYYDSPYFGRDTQDFSEFKKLDENIYNNKIKVLSEFKSQINWLKKETNIIEVLKFERILNGE